MKRLIAMTGLLLLLAPAAFSGGDNPTQQQRLVYGTPVLFNDTLVNAKVTFTLVGKDHFYTTTHAVTSGQYVTETDGTTGHFRLFVFGTDSLFPSGAATYTIKIEQPQLQKSGISFTVRGVTIAADSVMADSISLREILAQ